MGFKLVTISSDSASLLSAAKSTVQQLRAATALSLPTFQSARDAMTRNAAALNALIGAPGLSVMPGCYDAAGARLIADAGFEIGFVSGSSVAGARLARPDIDVLSFLEMVDAVDMCSTAAPEVLWMAD